MILLYFFYQNIHGELYEIDEKMLANLDILEEYPKLYTRREEPILMTSPGSENGQVVKMAWTYFLSDFRQELLNLPYIDCYRNGINNLEYVTRYVRDKNIDHRPEVKNNLSVPSS